MDREVKEPTNDTNAGNAQSSDHNSRRSDDGNSWWGSWGQGWIDTVKEKSASTLEMVKKDLNEFVEVIQGDTSVVISETATKLEEQIEGDNSKKVEKQKDGSLDTKEFVKHGVQGISKVLHSLSDLMSIQEPDDSNEEFITLSDDQFSLQSYNRKQEKLHNLQVDPGTYCNEPEGSFHDWLHVFSLDDNKEDMSNLLTQNPKIRAIYSQLVPSVVSHTTFWQRYYYQIFLLESEERRREELLKRASSVDKPKDEDDDDDGWGDEEDDIEIVPQNKVPKETTPLKTETASVVVSTNATEAMVPKTKDVDENNASNETLQCNILEPPGQTMHENFNVDNKVNKDIVTPISESVPEVCEVTQKGFDNDNTDNSAKTMASIENTTETAKPLDVKSDTTSEPSHPIVATVNNVSVSNKTMQTITTTDFPSISSIDSPSHDSESKPEMSETGSVGSWLSIDDDIKVKKTKEDQVAKVVVGRPISDGGSSSNSSGVLVNKSEADDLDDDFDMDLDDEVNEEELSKLVADIKNKSATGALQDDDDDDWENWE